MKTIACAFSFFVSIPMFAQVDSMATGHIRGRLMDAKTNAPLPYASVAVAGTTLGSSSEDDGTFTLLAVPTGTRTIVVSSIGYDRLELPGLVVTAGAVLDLGSLKLTGTAVTLNSVTVSPGSFSVMGTNSASRQTLDAADIKNMSWAEDLTRAVARLPGVSSNEFSSKFTVRGGETDEVLMVIDGMELYEPFHQRDFAGGLFSIVDIEAIQGIDLLTGGFAAEYGQRQSAVFNMRTKHVPNDERHTSIGLSIMNARVYTDGRFNKNKGSYLFSTRYGTLGQVLKLIGSNEYQPTFYDGMVKVQHALGEKHQLSFQMLHAADKTAIRDEKPNNYDRHDTRYTSTYAWLTWRATLSDKLFVRTLLYGGGIDHTRIGSFHKRDWTDKGDFSLSDKRNYVFGGVKQDWTWSANERFGLKVGWDARQLNASYDYTHAISEIRVNANEELYTFSRNVDIHTKPNGQLYSAYLSGKVMLLPKLFTEAGLRWDHATYTNDDFLSPRVSLAYAFGPNTFLRAAYGQYYQSKFINNLDVNHSATRFDPAELSTHYVLGFEHLFKRGISFRVEGYYKEISRISPQYQNLRDPWEVFPESRNDVVLVTFDGATAKGIEFFVKYDQGKKFSWWFSYALARAEETITNVEFDGIFEERTGTMPRPNNQDHTIYVDVNYRMNAKWHFSLSWQYYVGWPRTTYEYVYQQSPDSTGLHFYQRHFAFNGERYPAYHRLDARVNRHFKAGKGRITAFLNVINAYDRFNLRKFDLGIATNADDNLVPDDNGNYQITQDHQGWFGLTPIIGASWEF